MTYALLAALLPLPMALAQAPADAEDAAADTDNAATESAGDGESESPAAVLAALRQQLDGLDQSIKTLQEQAELNREEIAGQSERLDAELKRMDPIALRLDSLSQQLEQAQELLEKHETRIEDNSVQLYETLMGIDDIQQSLTELSARLQRQAAAPQPAATGPATTEPAQGQSQGEVAPEAAGERADTGMSLLPLALGLLLPAGILLYPLGRSLGARRASVSASALGGPSAAGLLLALVGAILGFALVGIGIRNGTSLGGIMGMPFSFLPELFALSPDAPLPAVAGPLLAQLPLVVAMAALAAVTAGTRLTGPGGLLLGLGIGALLLPLFGHWSGAAAAPGSPGAGWLAGLGFSDTGGVVGSALVGGAAALGLALGLGRERVVRPPEKSAGDTGHEPALLVVAVLLIWVGWLEPRLAAAPDDAIALVLASWAAAAGALAAAALFYALFRAGSDRLEAVTAALLAGIVAAPAGAAPSGMAVPLIFGALVGLLHGLIARALERGDGRRELAAAFAIGGLAAALAPALVGPDGFLFVPVAEDLPIQLLGAAVALVLGGGGGLCLGLLLRLLPGLLVRPRLDARREPSPAAAAPAA
ncbi:hypothetical protein [uncultured Thiohalocapsa sp.]|uniref:hypothetical protein n=1 Tax=uncultured Thiohalocapsa sp. TaxID=768990 RepID=UPI0025E10B66|nr:hypothetical protein [uncultured Thiohalocapsa sp.]